MLSDNELRDLNFDLVGNDTGKPSIRDKAFMHALDIFAFNEISIIKDQGGDIVAISKMNCAIEMINYLLTLTESMSNTDRTFFLESIAYNLSRHKKART